MANFSLMEALHCSLPGSHYQQPHKVPPFSQERSSSPCVSCSLGLIKIKAESIASKREPPSVARSQWWTISPTKKYRIDSGLTQCERKYASWINVPVKFSCKKAKLCTMSQSRKRCAKPRSFLESGLRKELSFRNPVTLDIADDISGQNRFYELTLLDEKFQPPEICHSLGVPLPRELVCSLLQQCVAKKDLAAGRRVHCFMVNNGLDSVDILRDHLIRLFTTCGSLQEVFQVFCKTAKPRVFTWQAIILACTTHGENAMALELFLKMQQDSIKPSPHILSSILKACGSLGDTESGRLVHDQIIIQSGLEKHRLVGNALVDMYAKCGSFEEAYKMFEKLPYQNVVSWNALIAGFAQHGHGDLALELYEEMLKEGHMPSKFTFSCILNSCGKIGAIEQGRSVHEQVIRNGIESDVVMGNIIISMYSRCGSLDEAHEVFVRLQNRDAVSWGTLLTGYVRCGHDLTVLELFEKMQQEGIQPKKISFLCTLNACGSMGAGVQGKVIHEQIVRSGLEVDVDIGSTLIDMYARCTNLKEARKVFDELVNRNVVSWNAMITGYVQQEHGLSALELFDNMQHEGFKPNRITFLCILKACGSIGAIGQGNSVHDKIIKSGLSSDVAVGNALVDMYCKCGGLEEAYQVFHELPDRDVVSWGAMIAGYAHHGNCELVRQCLKDMQQQGLKLDAMIHTGVLAACANAGEVEEGRRYFKSLKENHGISPSNEHFNCMVSLLGRTGHLNEAVELLETLPIPPDNTGWLSLLSACRTYGNVEIGRDCFDRVLYRSPKIAAGYVLMSNIYSDACMWKEVRKIQEHKKLFEVWKKPGKSWIEVNEKVHEFMVGDKTHPLSDLLYAKLESLRKPMEEGGYVPQFGLISEPASTKDKEDALCGHSEKLAIAFGLLSAPEGTTIRVRKNLRVCNDCHSASKIISKIERRPIILRDAHRFHHFEDGGCSCGDNF